MECECNQKIKTLKVETERAIYEIEFGQIQIEITGRCNMRCQHCRAINELRKDMPLGQIVKIIQFARQFSANYKEIIVSGGEPLLHSQFYEVLKSIKNNGGKFITLTTNGSLLTPNHLDFIQQLKFQRFMLSISLDSLDDMEHDNFRNHIGAYNKAIAAIRMMVKKAEPNLIASIRMTLRPEQISEMEKMIDFAYNLGCQRVSFSGIHPAGKAINKPDLWMTKEQKYSFLNKIYEFRKKYPKSFRIETNDPLRCLIRNSSDIGNDNEIIFDGCSAAAVTFNVSVNGDMTPCALMNLPIMNVFDISIEEIAKKYQESEIVKNMLDMKLTGKCGSCSKKYQCGGCRARAMIRNNHYLAEDPDCWLEIV
ncbi:MAG: radical SAM protein [Patescibacteria group bacterium]